MRRRPSPWRLTAPRGLLLALLLALAPAVPAAPAESEADAPERSGTAGTPGTEDAAAAETAAKEAPDQAPGPARDGEPSPEVFVPSEDISEDFAVPFPVDI